MVTVTAPTAAATAVNSERRSAPSSSGRASVPGERRLQCARISGILTAMCSTSAPASSQDMA